MTDEPLKIPTTPCPNCGRALIGGYHLSKEDYYTCRKKKTTERTDEPLKTLKDYQELYEKQLLGSSESSDRDLWIRGKLSVLQALRAEAIRKVKHIESVLSWADYDHVKVFGREWNSDELKTIRHFIIWENNLTEEDVR